MGGVTSGFFTSEQLSLRVGRIEVKRGGGVIHHVVTASCVSCTSSHLWCWFPKAHAAYPVAPLDKGICQVDYRSFLNALLLYCLRKF